MKSKDLAKILMQNPDAEVVFSMYNGGTDPQFEVNVAVLEKKGTKSSNRDGGAFIHKDGTLKTDVIVIGYDYNK